MKYSQKEGNNSNHTSDTLTWSPTTRAIEQHAQKEAADAGGGVIIFDKCFLSVRAHVARQDTADGCPQERWHNPRWFTHTHTHTHTVPRALEMTDPSVNIARVTRDQVSWAVGLHTFHKLKLE